MRLTSTVQKNASGRDELIQVLSGKSHFQGLGQKIP